MPKIKGRTLAEKWTKVKALDWVGECPLDGVHQWIWAAACACAWKPDFALYPSIERPEDAIELIRGDLTRPERGQEVARAVRDAYRRDIRYDRSEPREAIPGYDLGLLTEIASHVPFDVTDDYLAEQSPESVLDVSPASFLDALFESGERVWVGKHDADSGFIYNPGDAQDAQELTDYLHGSQQGAKYLVNPVSGEIINGSVRSEPNLADFRHLVIESDEAPRDLWLRMLVQVRAPILALYESGKRSVHAVIRLTAKNRAEFVEQSERYRRQLIPLGADKKVGDKPVQLTRLPAIMRRETRQLQKLLYLNPEPNGAPIYQRNEPVNATNADGLKLMQQKKP